MIHYPDWIGKIGILIHKFYHQMRHKSLKTKIQLKKPSEYHKAPCKIAQIASLANGMFLKSIKLKSINENKCYTKQTSYIIVSFDQVSYLISQYSVKNIFSENNK